MPIDHKAEPTPSAGKQSAPGRKRKLLYVFGTRPEAIKLAPLIETCKKDPRFETVVCSTGQHREMLKPVLEFFKIVPDFDLDLMKPGQRLIDVTLSILKALDEVVTKSTPDALVVQGDTTTCFATGLYGFYNRIPVYHVEAGLRSGDMLSPYPEEFNRKAVALTADLHFAPTAGAAENLHREGVAPSKVFITGNTGIDALLRVVESLKESPELKNKYAKLFPFLSANKKMVLVTLHRRENFGGPIRETLKAMKTLAAREDIQIVSSVHLNPNVREAFAEILGDTAVKRDQATELSPLVLLEPVDYIDFIYLMSKAHILLTDSGGIQEEAPYLGKVVLVARATTERQEALAAGNSELLELNALAIEKQVCRLLENIGVYNAMGQARQVFGDGHASHKILDIIAQLM